MNEKTLGISIKYASVEHNNKSSFLGIKIEKLSDVRADARIPKFLSLVAKCAIYHLMLHDSKFESLCLYDKKGKVKFYMKRDGKGFHVEGL